VAIEDAWELGYALRSQETVSGVRNDFFKKRRRRVQKYRRFSEFTEFLSGMSGNGFFARNGRDAMQFVPDPLNSTIFDFSLNESLGGKGYGMSGIS
jgi:2-polyprenyl-6-methoxyphenol hydroxylase-like FAD-dependent oxidoreductase